MHPSTLIFYGFQLHFVGESPLTGQNVLPLQVAVHHVDHRLIVAHVPHNHRQGFQPCQLCRVLAAVPGYDLVTSFRSGPGNERSQHAELSHALHRPLHSLIVQHLERVVFEGMQVCDGDLLDLLALDFL